MEETIVTGHENIREHGKAPLFDEDLEEAYDPFAVDEDDIDQDDEENLEIAPSTYDEAMLAHKPKAPYVKEDGRSAIERLRSLLQEANDQRPTLLAILSYCAEAKPVHEVNEMINRLKEENHSVYSAANLCSLLERTGGLVQVGEDGRPYGKMAKGEPRIVEIGGIRYFEPGKAPQVYWIATAEGGQVVCEDDPYGRLIDLLDREARVGELYRRVLLMCTREQGATAVELTSVVNMDPLAQNPVVTAPHFSVALKRCGALRFSDAWHTTELGLRVLKERFGIGAKDLGRAVADVELHAVPVPNAPATDDTDYYYGD